MGDEVNLSFHDNVIIDNSEKCWDKQADRFSI